MTHFFVVVVVAATSLDQHVEFTLSLEHLSFSLSTLLHMPLDKIIRLLVEELERGKDLSQTGLGLVEDLLHVFVR
jgi:hypothetical protein